MNITGTVVIDLARFVDHGYLYCGDHVVSHVWPLLGDGTASYSLVIGNARYIRWDSRLTEVLQNAEHIEVVGTDVAGVQAARRALRDLLTPGKSAA